MCLSREAHTHRAHFKGTLFSSHNTRKREIDVKYILKIFILEQVYYLALKKNVTLETCQSVQPTLSINAYHRVN